EVNRAIHRAETNVEPLDQFHEEDLRKERMQLKDQIAARLSTAQTG
ncbi:MAG: YdcH family protein, partial [Boseongicola sp.]|nr:YdcH family protein [Boseongicola sp.]